MNVFKDLKQTARGASGPRQQRMRSVLVAVEIALSLVLLAGAGLTIRGLIRVQQVPSGFNPSHVLTVRLALAPARYATAEQKTAFWESALRELRAVPGVEVVGATTRLPLVPRNNTRALLVDRTTPASADYRAVTPDYFRAMGIPLLEGRAPEERTARTAHASRSSAHRWRPDAGPTANPSANASSSDALPMIRS